jgi:hypothetical protein
LPKEPNGSKIGLGPKPIWGMSVDMFGGTMPDRRACHRKAASGCNDRLYLSRKATVGPNATSGNRPAASNQGVRQQP